MGVATDVGASTTGAVVCADGVDVLVLCVVPPQAARVSNKNMDTIVTIRLPYNIFNIRFS